MLARFVDEGELTSLPRLVQSTDVEKQAHAQNAGWRI